MKDNNNLMFTPKIKNKQRKKILIIASEEVSKLQILSRFAVYTNDIKNKMEYKELKMDFPYNSKNININLIESTGYHFNTHSINIKDISTSSGIIFIYSKYSIDSFQYIKEYIKNCHDIIGNKYFPCVYVQNETIYSTSNYSTCITNKEINEITMNGCFPLLRVTQDFNRKECTKIINNIVNEINKEKQDEFPYSLAYQEQLRINFCIKNHKLFNVLNLIIFMMIMFFTCLDTIFIINTQDFQNESKKVDDVFLGIRLNMNAINFISVIVFIKYALFEREKYIKIQRLEKYCMIVNLVSWTIQLLLHLRIQHLLKHNETYYSIKLYQIVTFTLLVASYQIMKYLTISNPQKQPRKTNSNFLKKLDSNRNLLV